MSDTVQVQITGIAAGGDGVARTGNLVIFTPRTAVGDVALVSVSTRKRFGRGTLRDLLVASPDRIDPPCAHYTNDRCGGCQLQHMRYPAQLAAKGTIISDSIRRIGRRAVETPDVVPSDAQWRYRRKLTLHVRRTGASWIAGLHPFDDPDAVFDLVDCPITDDRVLDVWRTLRSAFELLPAAAQLRVAVRLVEGGAAIIVEGGRVWANAEPFANAIPALRELWWKPEDGRSRQMVNRESAGEGASFEQVNATVAEALRQHVLARVRARTPRHVIDAYAGSGATSLPLAETSAVTAIELDARAVAQFEPRLAAPSRAISGMVEDYIARALPADVVILNPPRAGVHERVTQALESAEPRPQSLLYVSCDPATLARDIARMPSYRVDAIRAYDMFPQTAHVETVCELVPEAA